MTSTRILITGVSSPWGGRLAQLLERERDVAAVIGIDDEDPRHEFQRTEFVRVKTDEALLRRIIAAAAIDTVVDTRLISDPGTGALGDAHAVNVDGTRSLLSACAGAGRQLRKLVFRSSAHRYGCEASAPAFFTEEPAPRLRPQTAIERDVAEAEGLVEEFAAARPRATVTVLRFADVLGTEIGGSFMTLFGLPVVPGILGFDPRCQFVHQDDVPAALAHAARKDLPGAYNVAADGVLALSEVAALLGKPLLPVLPPWGTVFTAMQLRRIGLRIPVEMVRQLRSGRGLDNRRLKATGFTYRYTTREAVIKVRAQQRLRPLLESGAEAYRYEREVEEFLRWSPSVQSADGDHPADGDSAGALDGLAEGELLELIASMAPDSLRELRRYEADHGRRERVLEAIDRQLARRAAIDAS
jgi:UDP-glucose 4-epimerase